MMISDDKLNSIILKYSVLAGVADVTPIPGADVAAVTACQLKMFYELADAYEVSVTKQRFMELLSTLAAGIGGWSVTAFAALGLIKIFPGISNIFLFWQPPMVAAFTWAMGQVLKSYFPLIKEGKTWDKKEMQLAMTEAWQTAKKIDWKAELKNSVSFK